MTTRCAARKPDGAACEANDFGCESGLYGAGTCRPIPAEAAG